MPFCLALASLSGEAAEQQGLRDKRVVQAGEGSLDRERITQKDTPPC